MDKGERLASAVEQQLQCPICLLKLRIPRLLECMHTFCEECIANVAKYSQNNDGVMVRCPTCRRITIVSDVTKLPKNYIVENIVETLDQTKLEIEQQDVEDGITSEELDSTTTIFTSTNSPFTGYTNTHNLNNYNFSRVPSFDFGQREKASFVTALASTTEVTSTVCVYPSPSRSSEIMTNVFGYLTKSSTPVFCSNSADSSIEGVVVEEGRVGSGENLSADRRLSGNVFKFNAHEANVNPSFAWGSVEKTSFM